MKEKLKEYCEYELHTAERYGYNPHEAMTRAYGAIMFFLWAGESIGNGYDEDLSAWWDNEMLLRFRELEMKGEK